MIEEERKEVRKHEMYGQIIDKWNREKDKYLHIERSYESSIDCNNVSMCFSTLTCGLSCIFCIGQKKNPRRCEDPSVKGLWIVQ